MFAKLAPSLLLLALAYPALASKLLSKREVYNSLDDLGWHWTLDDFQGFPNASSIHPRLAPLDNSTSPGGVFGLVAPLSNASLPFGNEIDLLIHYPPFCGMINAVITFRYYMENGTRGENYVYPAVGLDQYHYELQNSTNIEWTEEVVAIYPEHDDVIAIMNRFESPGLFLMDRIIIDYIVDENSPYPCPENRKDKHSL